MSTRKVSPPLFVTIPITCSPRVATYCRKGRKILKWHENGFTKLKLIFCLGCGSCISHFWPTGTQGPEWLIQFMHFENTGSRMVDSIYAFWKLEADALQTWLPLPRNEICFQWPVIPDTLPTHIVCWASQFVVRIQIFLWKCVFLHPQFRSKQPNFSPVFGGCQSSKHLVLWTEEHPVL